MRKGTYALLAVVVCLLIIIFGRQYYHYKINITKAESIKSEKVYNKQMAKEKAMAIAKKKAEAKATYEKHKGEKIVYSPIGDSLGIGMYASKKSNRYSAVFADLIHKKMGYDVELMQESTIPGTGLKDNGLPNVQKIIAKKPQLVTIEFGTNDSQSQKSQYLNQDDFKNNLKRLISELRQGLVEKLKIVLITTWRTGQVAFQYDDVITTVGKQEKIPVANIEDTWINRTDTVAEKGDSTPFGISDGGHPNDKGHKEIAETIFKQAYDILK